MDVHVDMNTKGSLVWGMLSEELSRAFTNSHCIDVENPGVCLFEHRHGLTPKFPGDRSAGPSIGYTAYSSPASCARLEKEWRIQKELDSRMRRYTGGRCDPWT